jgi:hypothetical protein
VPAKLTKRAVEAMTAKEKPYDVRDTGVRGFLVRVEASGAKSFFLDYRLDGKRNRYRLGVYPNLSPDGARSVAQAIAGDVARGIDPHARRKADREQTERDRHSTLRAFLDGRYEPWAKTNLKSAIFSLLGSDPISQSSSTSRYRRLLISLSKASVIVGRKTV